MKPTVTAYFDEATYTVSYLVADPSTRACAIVDPVLDYDPASGRTSTASADRIAADVRSAGLEVQWIIETHAHADHLTGAPYLKDQVGGRIGIGEHIVDVQKVFKGVFNLPTLDTSGAQFDHLFTDDESYSVGRMEARAMHTPGHTPACVTHLIGDVAFVGDTLFMPDFGTARTDFPGGDAATLYRSIQRILALPSNTRLFMCHDYKAPGRDEYAWETSVADERENNVHLAKGVTENDFVKFRTERDATLGMPALLLPSLQVNIRAGVFPEPEDNGARYLKIPLNAL